jgi:hypothetical protein
VLITELAEGVVLDEFLDTRDGGSCAFSQTADGRRNSDVGIVAIRNSEGFDLSYEVRREEEHRIVVSLAVPIFNTKYF